ncbi:MAG: hypothetical protein H6891_07760 [Brucellaceae bacterium]|nr:hypothetical protein [Brucellaceae bacterium]
MAEIGSRAALPSMTKIGQDEIVRRQPVLGNEWRDQSVLGASALCRRWPYPAHLRALAQPSKPVVEIAWQTALPDAVPGARRSRLGARSISGRLPAPP